MFENGFAIMPSILIFDIKPAITNYCVGICWFARYLVTARKVQEQ